MYVKTPRTTNLPSGMSLQGEGKRHVESGPSSAVSCQDSAEKKCIFWTCSTHSHLSMIYMRLFSEPTNQKNSPYLQRGGERYVESSSSSMVSRQDRAGNMRIPLLDLLKSQLPRDPEGLEMAVKNPARRCSSAECVFSRQVRPLACLRFIHLFITRFPIQRIRLRRSRLSMAVLHPALS